MAEQQAGGSTKDTKSNAKSTTFAPNHVSFTVPEGAKVGDVHELVLKDGRKVKYALPPGTVVGEEHNVRVDSGTTKLTVSLKKEEKSTRLGITLTDHGDERHPVVTEMAEGCAASGLVLVGDIVLSVSDGPNVTVEATEHEDTSRLLRSAKGNLTLEILRPQVDVPTRVLYAAFLEKKSPKTMMGVATWQRRWFELSAGKITYWDLHVRSSGPKSHSYIGAQKGALALTDVAGVRQSADPKAIRKVDILMKSKRLFELAAPTAEEATAFAEHVRDALVNVLTAGVEATTVVDISESTAESGRVEGEDAAATAADSLPDAASDLPVEKLTTRDRAATSVAY